MGKSKPDISKLWTINSDISARQNSPPWIRRGGAGASQHGVVGTRAGRTTPATACGHGIPSLAEEGSISSLLLSRIYVALYSVPSCISKALETNTLQSAKIAVIE